MQEDIQSYLYALIGNLLWRPLRIEMSRFQTVSQKRSLLGGNQSPYSSLDSDHSTVVAFILEWGAGSDQLATIGDPFKSGFSFLARVLCG